MDMVEIFNQPAKEQQLGYTATFWLHGDIWATFWRHFGDISATRRHLSDISATFRLQGDIEATLKRHFGDISATIWRHTIEPSLLDRLLPGPWLPSPRWLGRLRIVNLHPHIFLSNYRYIPIYIYSYQFTHNVFLSYKFPLIHASLLLSVVTCSKNK